ncbi:hypothetical protein Aduo_011887 [Ancylostoma duodenale]
MAYAKADMKYVPLVYALTKDKTQATYEKIFVQLQQELQTLVPNLSPLPIILDFEVDAINAAGTYSERPPLRDVFSIYLSPGTGGGTP